MVKNKLHIIGCSFSTHGQIDLDDHPNDPTNYARVLATLLNLEPVAHAKGGQGNSYIYETLKNIKVDTNDTILVQLTQPNRKKTFFPEGKDKEKFGTVKLEELYMPPEALLTELNATKEEVVSFASIYDKFFTNDMYEHNLYCDAILSWCIRKDVKCIVLPLHYKKELSAEFKQFNNIKFSTNPWHRWDFERNGNPRNDHLTLGDHNKLAHEIYNDIT